MKTILVPVDFSDNSKNAMDYAIFLARHLKMKITLLHVFHPTFVEAVEDVYKLIANEKITGTPQDNRHELEMWASALKNAEKEIKCNSVFMEGDLANQIIQLMKNTPVDMIVMGTKGASGLKEVMMGSNTMRVIEKVVCPVVAVPTGFKVNGIGRIVFATDYREGDDISIRSLAVIAKELKSELSVVHILDKNFREGNDERLSENFVKGVAKSMRFDKIKFQYLTGTDILESLNTFIDEYKTDLLAISMTDKTFITSLFKKGLTWKLAYHTKIPLMVFPVMEEKCEGVANAF